MGFSALFIATTIISVVYARNNWNQACLSGSCSYDLLSNTGASGTIKIWGSEHAISDITPAAGWEILDCHPDKLNQDIRLVCVDESNENCAHLYGGSGAVDKIIRLPESCGEGPFARVARVWDAEDQTLPSHVAARVVRRDGKIPQVKALRFDTNFAAADASKTGTVYFALQGANYPGAAADGDLIETPLRRSRIFGRGEMDDFTSRAVDSISVWPFTNPNNIPFPSLDIDKHPLKYQSKFHLLDAKPPNPCPHITAQLTADAEFDGKATITVKASAVGTFFPPKITSFKAVANTTGDLSGTLKVHANVGGSLELKKKRIGREIGVPGLNYPGILTVGPYLALDAQAKASLDLDIDLEVGVNYHFSGAVAFPYDKSKSPFTFNPVDTPLKLSLSPSVKATAKVEAHLIPSINLGITAFVDFVKADVFLNLDAEASMTLELQAKANAGATNKGVTKPDASFGGCYHIDAGLGLNVGAEGDLFGLFNPSKVYPLLSKQFEIYKYCFGKKGRSLRFSSLLEREAWGLTQERREIGILSCPKPNLAKPQSVKTGTIKSKDIKTTKTT